jgi:predicted metal-dependent hydrolase
MAWQSALRRWLARKGREHLVPWLERVSAELELPYSGVTLRGQKSRWGSCSARRHINLNYALLFLPPHCVRYLFVHELCHTVHLNHSPRYWALVARKEPDYRRLEKELRQGSRLVPPWLHATAIHAAGQSMSIG